MAPTPAFAPYSNSRTVRASAEMFSLQSSVRELRREQCYATTMSRASSSGDRRAFPNEMPLVSVIMPAYNVEQYIAEAIESILTQSFGDFELIIVNDGSSDGTQSIIEEFARRDARIRSLSLQYNAGVQCARNLAIAQARGSFLAMMDADDISLPQRLEKQVSFLQSHPTVGIVGGSVYFVNERKEPIAVRRYWTGDAAIRKRMFVFIPFCMGVCMIRKSVFERAGMFNEKYPVAEDYDLYFRLGTMTQFANLNDVLYWCRLRPHSLSRERRGDMESLTVVLRQKYFQVYGITILDRIYHLLHIFMLNFCPFKWKYRFLYLIRQGLC